MKFQNEKEFTRSVIDLAQWRKWRVAHFRPARTQEGWRTAVQGDGKGFLDLVLARERLVVAELKMPWGTVSDEQEEWLKVLSACVETYLWYPKDWAQIERVLA